MGELVGEWVKRWKDKRWIGGRVVCGWVNG